MFRSLPSSSLGMNQNRSQRSLVKASCGGMETAGSERNGGDLSVCGCAAVTSLRHQRQRLACEVDLPAKDIIITTFVIRKDQQALHFWYAAHHGIALVA